jgi:hypothetical protein
MDTVTGVLNIRAGFPSDFYSTGCLVLVGLLVLVAIGLRVLAAVGESDRFEASVATAVAGAGLMFTAALGLGTGLMALRDRVGSGYREVVLEGAIAAEALVVAAIALAVLLGGAIALRRLLPAATAVVVWVIPVYALVSAV